MHWVVHVNSCFFSKSVSSTLLKLLQTSGLGCLLLHPPYLSHQALCCFTGVAGGREKEERSSTCFLFSLHALLATALLTSDCLYVYFGRDIRTVLEQWANQWNRTWQENMKVPSGGCWTEKWGGEMCVLGGVCSFWGISVSLTWVLTDRNRRTQHNLARLCVLFNRIQHF